MGTLIKNEFKTHNARQFIESLDVSEQVKEELSAISPFNYTGIY